MKPLDRNISILEHIVSYCQQIEQTIERFGDDKVTFQNDPDLPECRCTLYPSDW